METRFLRESWSKFPPSGAEFKDRFPKWDCKDTQIFLICKFYFNFFRRSTRTICLEPAQCGDSAHLQLDQGALEDGAVGIVTDVQRIEQIEVAALEEGAVLCPGPDLTAAVHRFFGDDEVAGNDVRHGVERDSVCDGPHPERVFAQDGDVRIAVQEGILPVCQVIKRLPDLLLEGSSEQ